MADNKKRNFSVLDKENNSNITLKQLSQVNNDTDNQPKAKKQKINHKQMTKINSTTKELSDDCIICHQKLKYLQSYQNDLENPVFEDVALTNEKLHLSIDGEIIDDDLRLTYKLINFR